MVGWPAMDRALLPSARLYAGLLIVELVFLPVLVVAVIWGLRVVGRFWTADEPWRRAGRRLGPGPRPAGCGWACGDSGASAMRFFGRKEHAADRRRGVRIYLGTEPGRRSLWAMTGESVGILAPPSYGKTSGQVIGAVAGWSRAVVSSTTKTDVCEATYEGRAELGPVCALDLDAPRDGIGPVPPVRFRLLSGWQDYGVALDRAEAIVPGEAGKSRGTEGFFRAQAVKLLAAYGHAAALSGGGLEQVLDWSSGARHSEALGDHRAVVAGACVRGPLADPYHRGVSGHRHRHLHGARERAGPAGGRRAALGGGRTRGGVRRRGLHSGQRHALSDR